MINLIIKGNMFDAFNAAHERGIALLTAAQTFNDRPSEVVASVDDSALDAVRTWFMASDSADLVPGFGYPAGALLFYSTNNSAAYNDERAAPEPVAKDMREFVERRQRNTADAYAHKPVARPIGTDPVDVLNAIDSLKGW
jgi:hypothetical protein